MRHDRWHRIAELYHRALARAPWDRAGFLDAECVGDGSLNGLLVRRFRSVGLQYFGMRTKRTIALPYRSDVPLDKLWPNGLKTETEVAANPGARVIAESDALPAASSAAYPYWQRSTQSNLYRIPIPN